MSKRKTAQINDLIDFVNERNRVSTCESSVRDGWNAMLERVLMDADVYAGFGYLRDTDTPEGQLPGIARDASGNADSFPDESRRFYHKHRYLQG